MIGGWKWDVHRSGRQYWSSYIRDLSKASCCTDCTYHDVGDWERQWLLPRLFQDNLDFTKMSQSNPAPIQTTSRPKSSLQARTSTARTPTGHPLARVTAQLDSIVPHFEIDPDDIQILDSPTTFYETLKVGLAYFQRVDRFGEENILTKG